MSQVKPYLKEEMRRRISKAKVLLPSVADTAERAAALGFSATANVKVRADSLVMAMADVPASVTAHYEEKYPLCQFLSWKFLLRFVEKLKLHIDTANHYTGVVPGAQLPYLEMFERDDQDRPNDLDLAEFTGLNSKVASVMWAAWCGRPAGYLSPGSISVDTLQPRIQMVAKTMLGQFLNSFFVVGPPNVFDQTVTWPERLRTLVDTPATGAPLGVDPLVVRPVRYGVLVVAAWGDEDDHLREALES